MRFWHHKVLRRAHEISKLSRWFCFVVIQTTTASSSTLFGDGCVDRWEKRFNVTKLHPLLTRYWMRLEHNKGVNRPALGSIMLYPGMILAHSPQKKLLPHAVLRVVDRWRCPLEKTRVPQLSNNRFGRSGNASTAAAVVVSEGLGPNDNEGF